MLAAEAFRRIAVAMRSVPGVRVYGQRRADWRVPVKFSDKNGVVHAGRRINVTGLPWYTGCHRLTDVNNMTALDTAKLVTCMFCIVRKDAT